MPKSDDPGFLACSEADQDLGLVMLEEQDPARPEEKDRAAGAS